MRKSVKVLFAVLIVVVALAMALTACHGGKYKMQDFVVDFSELAKTYEVGDTVDLSKVKMYATFSDGTQQDIPLDRVAIKVDGVQIGLNELSKITETTGTKIVEIKYSDVTRSVTIKVNEKHIAVLTGVEFDATNVVKEYDVLDAVSLEGLKVWAIYDEHDRREVALDDEQLDVFADGVILDDLDDIAATVGNKAITVRYGSINASGSFQIVVSDVLDSVVVKLPESFKTYKVGEAVSSLGVTATANYRSGAKVNNVAVKFYLGDTEITSNLAAITQTPGQKTVTTKAEYEDAITGVKKNDTKNFVLQVENYATGMALTTTDVQLKYVVGDALTIANFAGIKVNVAYAYGADQELSLTSQGVSCVNANGQAVDFATLTASAGTKVITVRYNDQGDHYFTDTFFVVVDTKADALESFEVTNEPTLKSYTAGANNVSLAGLVVTGVYKAEYAKQNNDVISSDFAANGVEFLVGGQVVEDLNDITKDETLGVRNVEITVRYAGKTDTFVFAVTNSYTGLQVVSAPTKVAYNVGENIDFANLNVKATKNYGEETVDYSALKFFNGSDEVTDNLNALTATAAAQRAVTVQFEGQEASFNISVENFVTGITLDTTAAQLYYVVDDALTVANFAGVKVNVAWADTSANEQLALSASGVTCVDSNEQAINFATLTSTSGNKVVAVKYANYSANFTVNVVAKNNALKAFSVTTQPTTNYTAGANVSFADLVVTGVYNDNLNRANDVIAYANFATYGVTLTSGGAPIANLNDLAAIETIGTTNVEVTVSYLGRSDSFNLTVTNNYTGLQIVSAPSKTTYLLAEDFNTAGLSVRANKNYGYVQLVLSDLTFFEGSVDVTDNLNALTASVADEKAVTVKFGGQEASFNISVEDYITGLELQGTKEFECDVNVTAGSKFTNFAGLQVYAVYKSGAKELLSSGYTFSGNEITSVGQKNVKVQYEDFEIGGITLVVNEVLLSIEVDDSTIPTKIVKNGEVERFLIGIKAYGNYAYKGREQLNLLQDDGQSFLYGVVAFELKVDDEYQTLSQLELDNIALQSGDRYVRLSYTFNGVARSDEFVINVLVSGNGVDEFSLPSALVKYNTTLANGRAYQDKEGTDQDANFEGSLYVGESEDYLVGDDNPYRFAPTLKQVDIMTEQITTLKSFAATSTIYLVDGSNLTPLVATKTGTYEKTWSYGGKNYVVETTNDNKYQFSADAIGKSFKLSVLPDANEFVYDPSDVNAVEWTVKVVDGYNIYDSREICLLEQPSQATRDLRTTKYPNGRTYWDSIKTELGLTGVRPTSIILHNSLQVTKTSLPQDFWFELDANYSITYKYGDNKYAPEDVPADLGGPLERAFLWDQEWGLLQYDMNKGESFAIHGNFFDIDLSKLPLVCSFEPDIEHPENRDAYYMDYMSKLSFIDIRGWDVRYTNGVNGPKLPLTNQGKKPTESAEQDEHFYFDNFMVKGNCSQTQLLLSEEGTTWTEGRGDNPVYGGGIIFVKTHYCHADVTNVNAHGCFISFFSRDYTVVNYTNCKSYDSYLNALYILGETDNTLTNCHFKRAGGPLMIVTQQTDDLDGDSTKEEYIEIPRLVANDNCVLENFVTGEEVWFDIFAPGQVTLLKPLDKLLKGYFTKTFLQGNSFNLIAVSSQGQCYVEYKGEKMDRLATDTVYQNASAFAANGSIVFSVGDTMCAVGQTSDKDYYLMNAARTELATAAASGDTTIATFSGDHPYITLHIGSGSSALGIFTGFMPYAG